MSLKNRIAELLKISELIEDLKKFKNFKEYFVTKEEDDINYYVEEQYDEFYVYQDPPLGVTQIIYGKCCCTSRRRKGYDDPVAFAGVYTVDEETGNITSQLQGYKKIDGTLADIEAKIINEGIKGYGKLFLTGGQIFHDFNTLKEYIQPQIENRDNSLSNVSN